MEFIDSYIEALRGEYLFLEEYYQVFKMKHSSISKNLLDKLFNAEVVELIKADQVGEDSYRLLVLSEKLEVKLPSILDEKETISTSTGVSKPIIATPIIATPSKAPIPKRTRPATVDPCSSGSTGGSSSYGAKSC